MTFALTVLLFLAGSIAPATSQPADDTLTVTAQWDELRQTIRGFGASDAWSTQFVGKHWPEAKRERIADLLFRRTTDEAGRPQGIGLSIWRFNVGAGSAAQGAESGISDPWRRAEGFLQADGNYDWSRQQGQRWFLRAAKERGVSTLIAFANSPPVELTANGKAFGDGSGSANLPPDRFDDFAEYLTDVARHFRDEGLTFDYISPLNEPQWNWSQDNNQEGSPYNNDQIRRLTEVLSDTLAQTSLPTKVEIPEAARIDFLYDSETDLPRRDDQIEVLFGDATLQAHPAVASTVAAHSYFTTWPVSDMIRQREQLAQKMDAVDPSLHYAMSEYCILADNEEIEGNGRDLGMDPALYVARVLHADLTVANASSWQWWLAVSPYDYKDGLVYVDRDRHDGTVSDSKLLWGLGNYSFFLQPGAARIAVHRSDQASPTEAARGLMVSGYRSADSDRVLLVAVNQDSTAQRMQLRVDGLAEGTRVREWQPYVTSASDDLAPKAARSPNATVEVPARSIVTFVGSL